MSFNLGTNYRANGGGRDHYIQFNNGGHTQYHSSMTQGKYTNLTTAKLMSGYRTQSRMRQTNHRAWSTTSGDAFKKPRVPRKVRNRPSLYARTAATEVPYAMGLLTSYDRGQNPVRKNKYRTKPIQNFNESGLAMDVLPHLEAQPMGRRPETFTTTVPLDVTTIDRRQYAMA